YAGGTARENKTMLWQIYSKFYNPFQANLIPVLIEGDQDSLEFTGNIIYVKDKIVGELDKNESLVYQLFTHKLHDSEVELLNRADIRIVKSHHRISTSFQGSTPVIKIDCKLTTTLIDSSRTKRQNAAQLAADLEKHLSGVAKS